MSSLGLGVFLALAAVCTSQFGGFNSPYGVARQPVGFNAGAGVPFGAAGPGNVAPAVGYDPFFSGLQRTQIYAQNLGYDQNSAAGPNCVNGYRRPDGICQCFAGYKGADCNVPLADQALDSEAGFVCTQTPGESDSQRLARAGNDGELGTMMLRLESLMATGGQTDQTLLTGPGFGNGFCPPIPSGAPMAPVHLKSALTDYGYISCEGNQLCYNKACPPCTVFSPKTGGCDHVPDPARRGLPDCNVSPGGASYGLKVNWYGAALSRPKISREGGAQGGPLPGGAPVGNNPFAARQPLFG